MSILSLFNGISGLHLACDRAGINVDTCYYSEIDKYANKVTEKHYPNDISLGDVTKWREWDIDWASIDLVGAGFPCQAWSVAGQQLGDKDERGMLFWTTLEIIKHVLYFNPKAKFLMENVKMKKDFEEYITHHTTQALGYVEKTLINSALVSAQNRNRYYWTNFEVTQPDDKGILLKDVLEDLEGGRPCEIIKSGKIGHIASATDIKGMDCIKRAYGQDGKAPTLTTMGGGHREPKVICRATVQKNAEHTNGDKSPTLTAAMGIGGGNVPLITDEETGLKFKGLYVDGNDRTLYRKLTPLECERLQNLPDNWTSILSNTQRYKSIGNGWTIDVIAHILKHI